MKKGDIVKFFKERPAISIRQIAMEAGYSGASNSLHIYLRGNHLENEVSRQKLNKLLPVMEKYGYRHDYKK